MGIWFFAKKSPDKLKRNISIGVAVISFFVIGATGSSSEPSKKEAKAASTQSTTEVSEKKIMILDIQKEMEADKEGKAIITGNTLPEAQVSVGYGIIGDSVKADKNGEFSLNYKQKDVLKDETITINATLENETKSGDILIKANAQVLQEKKIADQAAADQEAADQATAETDEATQTTESQTEADQGDDSSGETQYMDASGNGLIKGSSNGYYHVPGSTYYSRTTKPVAWFKTVSEAEEAGYIAPSK